MNKLKYILMVGGIFACLSPLMAQQKRISPHETVSKVIDGNRVTIVYGRPYTKDPTTGQNRKIWGELVPYGEVWRTGADEATLLITQKPILIGETTIPAGAYTLWTFPSEDGVAQWIINKQVGQWGIGPGSYDKEQDFARIVLKKEALDAPVDQFTIAISKNRIKNDVGKHSIFGTFHRPEMMAIHLRRFVRNCSEQSSLNSGDSDMGASLAP
jgi:hypothetical protein